MVFTKTAKQVAVIFDGAPNSTFHFSGDSAGFKEVRRYGGATNLMKQLKKSGDMVTFALDTILGTIVYTVENVKGKIVATKRT